MKTDSFKQMTKIALWALLLILPLILVGFRSPVPASNPEISAGLNGQQIKVEINCNRLPVLPVCALPKWVIKRLQIVGENQDGIKRTWEYSCTEVDPANCPLTVQTDGYWWRTSKENPEVIISGELLEISSVQIGSPSYNSKPIFGAFSDVAQFQIFSNVVVFKYDPFLNTWIQ